MPVGHQGVSIVNLKVSVDGDKSSATTHGEGLKCCKEIRPAPLGLVFLLWKGSAEIQSHHGNKPAKQNVRVRAHIGDETETPARWVTVWTPELAWMQQLRTRNQSLWQRREKAGGP